MPFARLITTALDVSMNNLFRNDSVKKDHPRSWLSYFVPFYDGTAADAWFTWVEWLLVTGALYAIAKAGDSTLFLVLAYFSAFLVAIYSAIKIESFFKPLAARTHRLSPALGWTLLLLIIAGQFAIMLAMGRVVDTMLSPVVK
jgi:hypothetical protein